MVTLQDRLLKVCKKGRLSPYMLAVWFERPAPTITRWIKGTCPSPIWLDEIERRLSKLEFVVSYERLHNDGLIPYDIPWKSRASYLKRLRDASLFESNSLETGGEMRSEDKGQNVHTRVVRDKLRAGRMASQVFKDL